MCDRGPAYNMPAEIVEARRAAVYQAASAP